MRINPQSDQERATLRRPCAHVWGMAHRAPDLVEIVNGIKYARPQWGKFYRECKQCHARQEGRGTEWGNRMKWSEVYG